MIIFKFIYYEKIVYLMLIIPFFIISCSNDDQNLIEKASVLNEKEIIKILSNSLEELRYKNSSLDKKNLKEGYKDNLNYLKLRTWVNLEYNEDEFNKMLSVIDGDLTSVFNFNVDKIKEFKETLYITDNKRNYDESVNILSEIFSKNNSINNQSSRMSWGCGLAIASNFGSTLGLTACITGVGCPLAIAMKVLALVALAEACAT